MLMPYLHHYYIIHDGSKCCGFKYEVPPPAARLRSTHRERRTV